jgi:DNA-binding MarR family transcriptional regulator
MLRVWKRELPGLDLATEGIVERVQRITRLLDRAMEETLASHELNRGEWRLLGSLRRSGPPYRKSPGQLAEELGLSSGAMTNRLDRMEEAGLVRRHRNPADRRSLEVELTEAGWKAWQSSTDAQAAKEALIASALTEREKAELNVLLRHLLAAFSDEPRPRRRSLEHRQA